MGSVMSEEKCKACNGVLFVDYYYKSGEEYSFCHRCGMSESFTLVRDEKGRAIKDEEGNWKFQHEKKEGHGVYGIFSVESGVGQVGTFNDPITEETIKEFREIFAQSDVDEERSYLAKWEDGKQTLLLGNGLQDIHTMDYEDLVEKWAEEARIANLIPAVGLEHLTRNELSEIINEYLREKINFVEDDFKITQISVVGSRLKGTHRKDSDLDIAFEYEGRYRPDSLCDTLNVEPLMIDDIRVDFVPYARYKGESINHDDPIEYLSVITPLELDESFTF